MNFIDKLLEAMRFGLTVSLINTTIPNHTGDMPEGTLRAILRQADIDVNEIIKRK